MVEAMQDSTKCPFAKDRDHLEPIGDAAAGNDRAIVLVVITSRSDRLLVGVADKEDLGEMGDFGALERGEE
jgi:hypothetical protein